MFAVSPATEAAAEAVLNAMFLRRGARYLALSFVPLHARAVNGGPRDATMDNIPDAVARCGSDDWFALGRLRELAATCGRSAPCALRESLALAIEAATASPVMNWWCRDAAEFPLLATLVARLHVGAPVSADLQDAAAMALEFELGGAAASCSRVSPRATALVLAMHLARLAAAAAAAP